MPAHESIETAYGTKIVPTGVRLSEILCGDLSSLSSTVTERGSDESELAQRRRHPSESKMRQIEGILDVVVTRFARVS